MSNTNSFTGKLLDNFKHFSKTCPALEEGTIPRKYLFLTKHEYLQCYKGKKNNVAISLKRLRSRDMA